MRIDKRLDQLNRLLVEFEIGGGGHAAGMIFLRKKHTYVSLIECYLIIYLEYFRLLGDYLHGRIKRICYDMDPQIIRDMGISEETVDDTSMSVFSGLYDFRGDVVSDIAPELLKIYIHKREIVFWQVDIMSLDIHYYQ